MRLALALTMAAFLASSALAAEPPVAAPAGVLPPEIAGVTVPAPTPPVQADDPIICRSAASTGTRLRAPKVCRKSSEWNASAKARGRAGEEIKLQGCDSGGTNCGVNGLPPG